MIIQRISARISRIQHNHKPERSIIILRRMRDSKIRKLIFAAITCFSALLSYMDWFIRCLIIFYIGAGTLQYFRSDYHCWISFFCAYFVIIASFILYHKPIAHIIDFKMTMRDLFYRLAIQCSQYAMAGECNAEKKNDISEKMEKIKEAINS